MSGRPARSCRVGAMVAASVRGNAGMNPEPRVVAEEAQIRCALDADQCMRGFARRGSADAGHGMRDERGPDEAWDADDSPHAMAAVGHAGCTAPARGCGSGPGHVARLPCFGHPVWRCACRCFPATVDVPGLPCEHRHQWRADRELEGQPDGERRARPVVLRPARDGQPGCRQCRLLLPALPRADGRRQWPCRGRRRQHARRARPRRRRLPFLSCDGRSRVQARGESRA